LIDFNSDVPIAEQYQQQQKEKQEQPQSYVDEDTAQKVGITHPQDEEQQNQQNEQTAQQPEDNYIQDATYGQKVADEFKAGISEASKILLPKKFEWDYKPQTRAGQVFKTYTKFLGGLSGLALASVATDGAADSLAANNMPMLAKGTDFISKSLGNGKFFKTGSTSLLKKAGVGLLNAGTYGWGAAALLNAENYSPDSENLFDTLGNPNLPLGLNNVVKTLQSDPNDTQAQDRLKNFAGDMVINAGFNSVLGIAGKALKSMFSKTILDTVKDAKNPTEETANFVLNDNQQLEALTNSADRLNEVQKIRQEASETGDDASQMILDRLNMDDQIEAQKMNKVLDEGNNIFMHKDGTWDVSVEKWQDASKVSPEEYKKQLQEIDEYKAEDNPNLTVRQGDTALEHADQAINDVWTERGWKNTDENLVNEDSKGQLKGNQTLANKLAKNYKDKFGIDNNIKVEFADGLKTKKGEILEGQTEVAKNIGKKIPKGSITDTENTSKIENFKSELDTFKIDEHKNQYITTKGKKGYYKTNITEPMDRDINQAESQLNFVIDKFKKDPINAIKEWNDTAFQKYVSSELPEEVSQPIWEKYWNAYVKASDYAEFMSKTGKDAKLLDITIKINPNTKNPYAVLRGELEHARDIAKNEVPKDKNIHFSRYQGDNEAEVAPNYVYKKAQARNTDIIGDTPNQPQLTEGSISPIKEPTPVTTPETQTTALKTDSDMSKNAIEPEKIVNPNTETLLTTKTSDDIVSNIQSGQVKAKTITDIDNIIKQTELINPEISGTTHAAIAKDADSYAKLLENANDLGVLNQLKSAYINNDVTTMDAITRRVAAVQHLTSTIKDKINTLGANPDSEVKKNIVDFLQQLHSYTKETGKASGRSLEARKFINQAAETFGSMRLSELSKDGINTLADLIDANIKDILHLNFTRGIKLTPQEVQQELLSRIFTDDKEGIGQLLLNDDEFKSKFLNICAEHYQSGGKIGQDELKQKLSALITDKNYEQVYKAMQLAPDADSMGKTVSKWHDISDGINAYYVHNLLSGIGTPIKNTASGLLNSVIFPTNKIIAGKIMGGGEELAQEGWNTLRNLGTSWQEAWTLCKQAFLKGDGNLSTISEATNEGLDKGLGEWLPEDGNLLTYAQNFHSFMTRVMGASDEFLTQLNYRSIIRGKLYTEATKVAEMSGKSNDEQFIEQYVSNHFTNAFDRDGRPTNLDAYKEAKDTMYQLPLNNKMFNPQTGEMEQIRPDTWTIGAADALNGFFTKAPILKIFAPFVKTGANILQQNLEYNPVYLALSPNTRKLLLSSNTTREAALAKARGAMGMFTCMIGCGMAMSGMVTGSAPSDIRERQALFKTGWKPYSIKVGNQYISYQGYEPIHTLLGLSADMVNIGSMLKDPNDINKFKNITTQTLGMLVNNFIDKAAFRTGLSQFNVLLNPEGDIQDMQKSLAQLAQGFLPDSSLVRNLSSAGNRDVTMPKTPYERLMNNFLNRGLGDLRRDDFGNPQSNFGALFTNIAPDKSEQPEYKELMKLSEYGFIPSQISQTISDSDTKLKLTDFKNPQTNKTAYDAMLDELSKVTIDGKTLQQATRELVTSPDYQSKYIGLAGQNENYNADDPTQINDMRALFIEYNDLARQNVLDNQADNFVDGQGNTMEQAKEKAYSSKMLKLNSMY
jgi:hypothetical protein